MVAVGAFGSGEDDAVAWWRYNGHRRRYEAAKASSAALSWFFVQNEDGLIQNDGM
jgi:hypothetical protein